QGHGVAVPVFGEPDAAVEGVDVQCGQGVPHRLGIHGARVLHGVHVGHDAGSPAGDVIGQGPGVVRPVKLREIPGAAEVLAPVVHRLVPVDLAHDAVRV